MKKQFSVEEKITYYMNVNSYLSSKIKQLKQLIERHPSDWQQVPTCSWERERYEVLAHEKEQVLSKLAYLKKQ